MKMIYITRDNKANVESISSSKTMVEKDGYHHVPNNTIYSDASGREDSITIIYQGRVLPHGNTQTKDSLEQLMYEIIATSLLDGHLDVDTAFGRFLKQLMHNAIPVGIAILFILIGLGALFQGGG